MITKVAIFDERGGFLNPLNFSLRKAIGATAHSALKLMTAEPVLLLATGATIHELVAFITSNKGDTLVTQE